MAEASAAVRSPLPQRKETTMTIALKQVAQEPDAPGPDWYQRAVSQEAVALHIEVNSNLLHYLAWNAQDTDKPALLFVHGFRAHARWWDFIAPFFTATHRVFAMDLSGMGDSGWRESYSPQQLAGDVSGFIQALGLGATTVVAHSYGGLCTLRAAAERPDLFKHVVVIDTYVVFEGAVLPRDPARITGSRIYSDYASARARYRLLPEQPTPIPCLVDHVARHSLRAVEGGLRWKFDGRLQEPETHAHDGEAMLRKIAAPVDYIYGECSALIDEQHARRITNALPNVRGPIAIPDGHHHLMLDQPIALISSLRALLCERKSGNQPE